MISFGQSGLFWSEIIQLRVGDGEYFSAVYALSIVTKYYGNHVVYTVHRTVTAHFTVCVW